MGQRRSISIDDGGFMKTFMQGSRDQSEVDAFASGLLWLHKPAAEASFRNGAWALAKR